MGVSNGGAFTLGDTYLTTGLFGTTHQRWIPTFYAADGIIGGPGGVAFAQHAIITKATAAAMTIPAPLISQNGDIVVITSQTAAAHTVTGVGLLADGVSGSPHGTATFAAFKGASLTLMADNLLWNVIANVGVTIA